MAIKPEHGGGGGGGGGPPHEVNSVDGSSMNGPSPGAFRGGGNFTPVSGTEDRWSHKSFFTLVKNKTEQFTNLIPPQISHVAVGLSSLWS